MFPSKALPTLCSKYGVFALLSLGACSVLAGCGMGPAAGPIPVSGAQVSGRVHGGQQAVEGALIQLYEAGSGGNGSAAKALLSNPVYTDANGSFLISGYTCDAPQDQVYLVATGGNPGLGAGGENPALVMMAALGDCQNLASVPYVWINEVTTAVAAWTLAPFTGSYANIGASATNNNGLRNAFLNAALLTNTSTGQLATLASGLTTEQGKIYALADALASCVNSDGGSACSPLFTAATPNGGSAPETTFDAALNIVKNPGNNVAGVWSAIGPQPPFPTTLTQAPNDWTLSLTITGGGLSTPTALALDSQGNVWVADEPGAVSAFGPQGTPLNAAGYTASQLSGVYGLAIDAQDNVWATSEAPNHTSSSGNTTAGSVYRLMGVSSGGTLGQATQFVDINMDYPNGPSFDTKGDLLVANYYNASVSVVNASGTTPVYTEVTGFDFPNGVTGNTSGGFWVVNEDVDTLMQAVPASGSPGGYSVSLTSDCCGRASYAALDSASNVWVALYDQSDADDDVSDGAVMELGPDGTVLNAFLTGGGIYKPSGIAIDAGQNVWVSNFLPPERGVPQSFSELAGSTSTSPGTGISPSTGYGLDAGLIEPYAIAVDASGNVWITNSGEGSLVEFFGMATPTATPKGITPVAP